MRTAGAGLAARATAASHSQSMAEIVDSAHDPAMVGRLVEIGTGPDGQPVLMAIDGNVPGHTVEGIGQATGVDALGQNRYRVSFADGSAAVVDFSDENNPMVAFSGGDEFTPAQLHGALAMAAGRHHHLADGDVKLARLADAFAAHQETIGGYPDEEAVRALALAASDVLADAAGDVQVNPASMSRWIESQRQMARAAEDLSQLSPAAQARRRARKFGETVRNAMERGLTQNQAIRMAMFHTHEFDGKVINPSPQQIEAYNQGAAELGGEIVPSRGPDGQQAYYPARDEDGNVVVDNSGNIVYTDVPKMTNSLVPHVPNWHMGTQERLMLINMQHHASIGTRTFFIAGPPGTGKTLMAKKWAELHEMPFSEFTLGEGVSVQALLGDTGMKTEIVRDDDGKVVGAVPKTGEQQGKLLRALKQPGVVCINEAEDIEEALLALNTALNDRVGATDSRTINTNTAEGDDVVHMVHPDCYIVVTWNPGHDDKAPKESSMDRGLVLHMKRGTPSEEAPKYAQMMRDAMSFQTEVPGLQDMEITDDDAEVIARLAQKLQNAYNQNPAEFRREVGPRTMGKFGATLVLEAAKNSEDHPIEIALMQLRGILPAYPAMSDDQAQGLLRQICSDEFQNLLAFTKKAYEHLYGSR